jgi:hypothetical protein
MSFILPMDTREELELLKRRGRYFVELKVVHSINSRRFPSTTIKFIVDTGAYLTIIERSRAEFLEIDLKNDGIPHKIAGYSGEAVNGRLINLYGMCLGKTVLTGVPIFVPLDKALTQNLLATNVLDYFKQFYDTEAYNSDENGQSICRLILTANPTPDIEASNQCQGSISNSFFTKQIQQTNQE